MAICPRCGSNVQDSAPFCPNCGYQMNVQVGQPVIAYVPRQQGYTQSFQQPVNYQLAQTGAYPVQQTYPNNPQIQTNICSKYPCIYSTCTAITH